MNSIDPVKFTRRYLAELDKSGQISPGRDKSKSESGNAAEKMWYSSGSKTVPARPPSQFAFAKDIQKMKDESAPARDIESYCGLSLLMGVISAVNAGTSPLVGPLFVGIASSTGWSLTSPETQKELGLKAGRELISQTGVSEDPELVGRLDRVGQELLEHSTLDKDSYQLVVLDSDEINAHSTPGFLMVTRGMMEQFPEDGHLALFVGHEIAHAEGGDSVEGVGQDMFENLAISRTLLKSKVKVEGTDQNIGHYRKALKNSFYDSTLAHDRENELTADYRGAGLMLKAGYNQEDVITAIKSICQLEEEVKLDIIEKRVYQELGYNDEAEVQKRLAEQKKFDEHPDVSQRLERVQQAIEDFTSPG